MTTAAGGNEATSPFDVALTNQRESLDDLGHRLEQLVLRLGRAMAPGEIAPEGPEEELRDPTEITRSIHAHTRMVQRASVLVSSVLERLVL